MTFELKVTAPPNPYSGKLPTPEQLVLFSCEGCPLKEAWFPEQEDGAHWMAFATSGNECWLHQIRRLDDVGRVLDYVVGIGLAQRIRRVTLPRDTEDGVVATWTSHFPDAAFVIPSTTTADPDDDADNVFTIDEEPRFLPRGVDEEDIDWDALLFDF